jgi:hypothetical protein
MKAAPLPAGIITLIRGEHVIVDADLAILFGVTTSALNQAVKRNRSRFPAAYMFRLTRTEAVAWLRSRSQSVILKRGTNLKYLPRAFTEHGALMAANVLQSPRAIAVSIRIINAFVALRKFALTHDILARKLAELEARYDGQFDQIFAGLRSLLASESKAPPSRKMGFVHFD